MENTVIKLYLELHWGKRRPNLLYKLNGIILNPVDETFVTARHNFTECVVVTLNGRTAKNNLLEIVQYDKTDNDIGVINNEFVDHWIKIRNICVDGVYFETALFNQTAQFNHSMSDSWVNRMHAQGHCIEKCYKPGTDIRLNGTWQTEFTMPIWEWCVKNYI
jgi:hypothetical protein